eukprot:scaffold44292_cov69-Phaeocystis_antarctica.AAC.1
MSTRSRLCSSCVKATDSPLTRTLRGRGSQKAPNSPAALSVTCASTSPPPKRPRRFSSEVTSAPPPLSIRTSPSGAQRTPSRCVSGDTVKTSHSRGARVTSCASPRLVSTGRCAWWPKSTHAA